MKKILLLLLLISQNLLSQNKTLNYIDSIDEIAIEQSRAYGIPAAIIIAQAVIESASGTSTLAKNANNHFGIKCSKGWNGKFMLKNDEKPNSCFRSYDSIIQCFQDYSRIISTRDRYQFLFNYPTTDYKKWAYGLKKAGYATNPNYPQVLIKNIEKYKLYQYDIKN